MSAAPTPGTAALPPLAPALAAMIAVQVVISAALFAPGILAPRLGLGEAQIGLFSSAFSIVGVVMACFGGVMAARFGSFAVAAFCMAAVAVSMLLATLNTSPALALAGLALGLAFGPETPASSALLGRLAAPRQRPLVFSVRQTGNQVGAMIASLTLPSLAAAAGPLSAYAAIAALGSLCAALFLGMRRRYDHLARGEAAPLNPRLALALIAEAPDLRRLALASMPWAALQLALNAFLVPFAVDRLALPHVTAGLLLATAQGGGLAGRLAGGVVAGRFGARRVIVALGLAMAVSTLAMALASSGWPTVILFPLALVVGITVSGWNGVFLAEVARLAPQGRVAEATGAVLMATFSGLVLGPPLIAALAAAGSLALSYGVLAVMAGAATLPLIRRPPAEQAA